MELIRGSSDEGRALSLGVAVLVLAWTGVGSGSDEHSPTPTATNGIDRDSYCLATDSLNAATSPDFYKIELVPTGNVPGTGSYTGVARVSFEDTPFDVAVSEDGTFHRRVRVDMSGVKQPESGGYVVWVSPPELEPIKKLGVLDSDGRLTGEVSFPKYLVIVTLEENPKEIQGRWQGPVVHRGMSKSGFMHGMAGHGPFRQEPCANYGFQ